MYKIMVSIITSLLFITAPLYAQSKGGKSGVGSSGMNSTNKVERSQDRARNMMEDKTENLDRSQDRARNILEDKTEDLDRNQDRVRNIDAKKESDKQQDRLDTPAASMADTNKGLAMQRENKSEQVQKELDKGSEQGQTARQENSRKWWKFWE